MIRARLRLFGEPTLTAGPDLHASPIDLSQHVETLLAYLALHPNQPIDRRKLAFILWADTTEATALRNLRQYLHRLRQILASLPLPDEILVSKGSLLFFKPMSALWIDVTHFERQITDQRWQIEAIELYRGDLLKNYEAEWVLPLRTQLRDQYLHTLRNQITIANMQRNYPRAQHYAGRLLAATPLRESSNRIYMEALYFNGQRVRALQHFNYLQDLLKRTLNTEPMPQTVTLYQQIKNGTLPGDMPPFIVSSRQASQTLTTISQISASFVGRRRELALLDDALARTLNGWGRLILIEGDSGIGKTRLLQTWQQARAEQLLIFGGQAQADKCGIPGAPVLEALRQGRDQIDWQWFPARSPRVKTLHALLCDLESSLSSPSQGENQFDDWPSADKLGQFILTLADRADYPVGLLLDDLHNADETTWHLLAFLARRCSTTSLLVVGTYQPNSLPATVQCLLHSLQRHQQLQIIELWPLSPADTAKLAIHLLHQQLEPDRSFLNQLYRVTEGNPFFITEFLKSAQPGQESLTSLNLSAPPKSVQAVIGARLEQLPVYSHRLLAIAATIGRTFNFRVLAGATPHYTDNEVLEALEDWLEKGLVVEKSEGYEFKHEQIQQAAYAGLTPSERRQAHQEIARALITLPLEPHLRDPARLAYHYLNSNNPEQALPDLIASGKRASAMASRGEAIALARQSLELMTKTSFRSQVSDLAEALERTLEPPENIDQAYAILDKIVEIWLNQ
jgi:DNA-binding SARP family transcriptional activator